MQVGNPTPTHYWTRARVSVVAAVCLMVGMAFGYLARGSFVAGSSPGNTNSQAEAITPSISSNSNSAPEQLEITARTQAAPLLEQLKNAPSDAALLARIGNVYYDTKQYKDAVGYYQRSLEVHPDDVDVRADLGTCYWYQGEADSALAEYQKALARNPKHPGTLYNLGIVRWQGKMDPRGAVQAWETLLKLNPDYQDKDKVLGLIREAKSEISGARQN